MEFTCDYIVAFADILMITFWVKPFAKASHDITNILCGHCTQRSLINGAILSTSHHILKLMSLRINSECWNSIFNGQSTLSLTVVCTLLRYIRNNLILSRFIRYYGLESYIFTQKSTEFDLVLITSTNLVAILFESIKNGYQVNWL